MSFLGLGRRVAASAVMPATPTPVHPQPGCQGEGLGNEMVPGDGDPRPPGPSLLHSPPVAGVMVSDSWPRPCLSPAICTTSRLAASGSVSSGMAFSLLQFPLPEALCCSGLFMAPSLSPEYVIRFKALGSWLCLHP